MAITLHVTPGRKPWEYKKMTEKQRAFLINHISTSKLNEIDRGAASMLIADIIDQSREAGGYDSMLEDFCLFHE